MDDETVDEVWVPTEGARVPPATEQELRWSAGREEGTPEPFVEAEVAEAPAVEVVEPAE